MNNLKTILWWGRFDPNYSRNRILRNILEKSGCTLFDFRPHISALGDMEIKFSQKTVPDAVWVSRPIDFKAAHRYTLRYNIPLIFDPMISAWDKAVFERKKFPQSSSKANRLLQWERSIFSKADLVLADTQQHADFFTDTLGAIKGNTFVVPVGSEEDIFRKQPCHVIGTPPEIFFYGSFITLQGSEVIVEAAKQVPEAQWTLLGEGPLKEQCQKKSLGFNHIKFENWLEYEKLPERIGKADIILGIFGSSDKASRVIPNKVYQSLSCGRPLITRESIAYPSQLEGGLKNGIEFIPAGDAKALSSVVKKMLLHPELFPVWGDRSRATYDEWFSESHIKDFLNTALEKLKNPSK